MECAPTIDSQVHAYERNHVKRPWRGFLPGPDEVNGEDMIQAMDAAGVDGALLVSPFAMYGYDPSYALTVYAQYPDRFALIKPFDPASASVEEEIAEWAASPGVVGTRVLLDAQTPYKADHGGLNRIFESSSQNELPVAVHAPERLALVRELAKQHPRKVVLDHLGLAQPLAPPPAPAPFLNLGNVVALAELDNIAIKISSVCTLSHQSFPYEDI